ncbi:type II secretion system protein [Candidatus Uhrbacteria bacterium]|nr:type II secretion system protein [Candidatus Uhrbacteria bacterium]
MTKPRGFTLLELLIVLAIVAMLSSVAVYSLGVSRAKSRDAKRASDVSVLRSALSQYWLQKAGYPLSEGVDLGRPGAEADGLTSEGFVGQGGGGAVILPRVPIGPKSGEFYRYKGTAGGYSLRFVTERETVYGPEGTYYGHAGGVDSEDVEK